MTLFAWAGRPGKKDFFSVYFLCVSVVKHFIVNSEQRGLTDHSFNSLGDDPFILTYKAFRNFIWDLKYSSL